MSESKMNNISVHNDDDNAPDATVVVCGKEFREHSNFLCYFRGAIRSGVKESETLIFNFPDKDPAEWELFMSCMRPGSQICLLTENVEAIVMWSAELCVTLVPMQELVDLESSNIKQLLRSSSGAPDHMSSPAECSS
jgi:hypothetical protein